MKFRSFLLPLILITLVIAWFTKPGYEQFKSYHAAPGTDMASPPVIEYSNGYVYSMVTVSYYDIKKLPVNVQGETKAAVAVPHKKERYLGLFGKFWKLN